MTRAMTYLAVMGLMSVLVCGPVRGQSLSIVTVSARPGAATFVPVRMDEVNGMAGIQADLWFPPEVVALHRADGTPDCALNPAVEREQTAFAFLPIPCTPGVDCVGVRVLVVSFTAAIFDPLPTVDWLFGCAVRVSSSAEASAVVTCTNALASPPPPTEPPYKLTAVEMSCVPGAILIDGAAAAACIGDQDGDGRVMVEEVVRSVESLLSGCPQ